jgi:hypothetical protein
MHQQAAAAAAGAFGHCRLACGTLLLLLLLLLLLSPPAAVSAAGANGLRRVLHRVHNRSSHK